MTQLRAESVLDLIADTPHVRLNRVPGPESAEVWVKCEFANPGASVKDRICLAMIEDAEKRGALKKGAVVVEPTSGNTGVGLALVCAVKGYRLILTMPESMSLERRALLKAFGAELVLTPAEKGMPGAIKRAEEIMAENGPNVFMPQQFKNAANPDVHRRTTAREILKHLGKIDAFVAGVGTGGTITGVGEVLKEENPTAVVVAVEPTASPVLSGGAPGPHKIQGIGAGFVPDVLNRKIIDRVIQVSNEDAIATAKKLAKMEGLLVGISSGANVFAALQVARELGRGKKVCTIGCDTGERYLSMGFFAEP